MLILIVEDEAAIARFLKRGLGAHGHRVICAYDGEEGTRLAVDEPVDLVLLDTRYPVWTAARCSGASVSGARTFRF